MRSSTLAGARCLINGGGGSEKSLSLLRAEHAAGARFRSDLGGMRASSARRACRRAQHFHDQPASAGQTRNHLWCPHWSTKATQHMQEVFARNNGVIRKPSTKTKEYCCGGWMLIGSSSWGLSLSLVTEVTERGEEQPGFADSAAGEGRVPPPDGTLEKMRSSDKYSTGHRCAQASFERPHGRRKLLLLRFDVLG